MRRVIVTKENKSSLTWSDNHPIQLLDTIDDLLRAKGFELVVGDDGGDDYPLRIDKRKVTPISPSTKGVCRHRAVYCGLVMGEQYQTRIITGPTTLGRHAQAQACINGNWEWLEMDGYVVKIGNQEHQWLLDDYKHHVIVEYAKEMVS